MSFSDNQTRLLQAKLRSRYVKTRILNGETLSYIEGWHVISEANRIFGFGQWDRQTLSPQCHWAHKQSGETVCFYTTKARVSVRAGGSTIVREGLGTGMGRSQKPEIAHDIAIKAAETDATKRALVTFGNVFGLALYDPQQAQVTRSRSSRQHNREFILTQLDGEETALSDINAFADAMLKTVDQTSSLDDLYGFWALNASPLRALDQRATGRELAARIIDSIKHRARQIGAMSLSSRPAEKSAIPNSPRESSYLIPKEKRIRDRAHLAFVATRPCLICGRHPTQAHHLRFAQQTAMSLKVSDEYTVPLCTTHHDQLHRSGNEKAFWKSNNVSDPLAHASKLWALSHPNAPVAQREWHPDIEEEFNEPSLKKGTTNAPNPD